MKQIHLLSFLVLHIGFMWEKNKLEKDKQSKLCSFSTNKYILQYKCHSSESCSCYIEIDMLTSRGRMLNSQRVLLLCWMARNTKHAVSTPASESSSMTHNAFIYIPALQAQDRLDVPGYVWFRGFPLCQLQILSHVNVVLMGKKT